MLLSVMLANLLYLALVPIHSQLLGSTEEKTEDLVCGDTSDGL